MTNLSANLTSSARLRPDGVALRSDLGTMSYATLEDHVARLASYLVAAGVSPGERVAIMLADSPAFAIVYFAVLRVGAVAVPVNPRDDLGAVEFVLHDTDARALFFGPQSAGAAITAASAAGVRSLEVDDQRVAGLTREFPRLARPVSRQEDATAVILHEQVEGVLRGIRLSHHHLQHHFEITAVDAVRLSSDDIVMGGCAPFSQALGLQCALLGALSSAATLVLMAHFDARLALEAIATESVTVLPATGTVLLELLSAAERFGCDTRSLKYCVTERQDPTSELRERIEATFECVVLEVSTNAASCCAN